MVGAREFALRSARGPVCYTDGYMHHWRGCCRPLLGVTCAGATDERVCVMLDRLSPHASVDRVTFTPLSASYYV